MKLNEEQFMEAALNFKKSVEVLIEACESAWDLFVVSSMMTEHIGDLPNQIETKTKEEI